MERTLYYSTTHYYAAGVHHRWTDANTNNLEASVTARTYAKLFTGGKASMRRQSLFRLHCDVAESYGRPEGFGSWWGFWYWWGDMEWPTRSPIDPTTVRIMGQWLGADGNLWVALPDNACVDAIASAPARHYNASVSPTKYKLNIIANNVMLQPDQVGQNANYCVGQKINLSSVFTPALSETPTKQPVKWALGGTYINAFTTLVSDSETGVSVPGTEGDYDFANGLTAFRVDTARLHQESTFAWWQTGSTSGYETNNVSVGMGLTFANGQFVVVTAKGQIGMHQPTVTWDGGYYAPGVVGGENWGPYYKVGLLNKAVFIAASSQSLVQGRFGITQLIKRTSSGIGPLGNWSDWKLDDSMPYNKNSQEHYQFSPSSPLGIARDHFYDQPSVGGVPGGFLQAYCVDQFKQFFMFRPTDSNGNPLTGSIWVTLGTDTWNWSGSIGPISMINPINYNWTWIDTPSFFCSEGITSSHQHPEFQSTRPALGENE